MSSRRVYIELLTCVLFVNEFFTNILRWIGLGRRYYRKTNRIPDHLAIVTGANGGIGKETVLQLVKRGATVIMGCRDITRGMNAARDILNEFPRGKLEVWKLDLASLDSVNRFVDKVEEKFTNVDILINNAAVMMCPKLKSEDNFELQFATNHLGKLTIC